MYIVRRVGAALLVALAVGVWFGMAPEASDHRSDVTAIEADDDANNARADGAPQQAVVNGWTTTAYLRLLSTQLDEVSAADTQDERPGAMLGLCVVGIALMAATSTGGRGMQAPAILNDRPS